MSRPKCCRHVSVIPNRTFFCPKDAPLSGLAEVILTVDEFEAIRLADLEELYQEQAAALMNVSRQTFGRIIGEAHRKMADVLVNGKTLKIEGGPVSMEEAERVACHRCRRAFTLDREAKGELICPQCRKQPQKQIFLKRSVS
jgi:uncharacterized protein